MKFWNMMKKFLSVNEVENSANKVNPTELLADREV